MSVKVYEKDGFYVDYGRFIAGFNIELKKGYDWYIFDADAIGIKRKDKDRTVTNMNVKGLDELGLNYIRAKYKLY